MSTRGCVAIKQDEGWRGVYNHWDSYPTGLGKEVWDYLHQNGVDLQQFAKELLEYGDWREYLNNGVCEYCGKRLGQPVNISGVICLGTKGSEAEIRAYWEGMSWAKDNPEKVKQSMEQDLAILKNIQETGYSDPDAKYHSHATKDNNQITNLDADPLFIEWVYVIDPERRTMSIIMHKSDGVTKGAIREVQILRDDGFWDYGHCAYKHIQVAEISLNGDEPDWERIEKVTREDEKAYMGQS